MALPKREVEELSTQELEQVQLAEDSIDRELKEKYVKGEKMIFPIKMSSRCREELKRRYEAAGWKVTYSAHPSDVFALMFELS